MHTKLKNTFLKLIKQPCPFSHDPFPGGGICQRFYVHCGEQGFSFVTSLLLCLHHPPRPQCNAQDTASTSATKKWGSNAGTENKVTLRWPQTTAAALKPDRVQHLGQPLPAGCKVLFAKQWHCDPKGRGGKMSCQAGKGSTRGFELLGKTATWLTAALF